MSKVQFIKTPTGDELAVLPRAEFEQLRKLADEGCEDRGTARLAQAALDAVERGDEIILPAETADRLAAGYNPIRVVREWRGLSQAGLSAAAGIGQGYLSDLEKGRRRGPAELMKKLARALNVPLDLLIP